MCIRDRTHLDAKDTASGWNAIFAWGTTSQKDENYLANASAKHVETQDAQQTRVVNSASKLESSKVHVQGAVQIEGVSMLPTQAFVFAVISTITFEDGTSMRVINQSNPMAASQGGDTTGVNAKPGQLKVVPVS